MLDANLLLLWIVGTLDRSLVARHKRTCHFRTRDFDVLLGLLARVDQIVVTPGILTECSNLLRQAPNVTADRLMAVLAQLVASLDEQYVPAASVSGAAHFCRLGLTDATILGAIGDELPLLTTDVALYTEASRVYPNAVFNFDYLPRL
jgi:hypothetical protein